MPTKTEIARVINALNPREPLGAELHTAGIRVFATQVAVEVVALRSQNARIEVLLRQRGTNEPAYPGAWHCPGCFVRYGETLVDVFARLAQGEHLGQVVRHDLVDNFFFQEERGWICSATYLAEVHNPSAGVTWFPVDDLPDQTIAHHAEVIIPAAVARFQRLWGSRLREAWTELNK